MIVNLSTKRIYVISQHGTFIRLLPTRWRLKPYSIDMERNYVTVTYVYKKAKAKRTRMLKSKTFPFPRYLLCQSYCSMKLKLQWRTDQRECQTWQWTTRQCRIFTALCCIFCDEMMKRSLSCVVMSVNVLHFVPSLTYRRSSDFLAF